MNKRVSEMNQYGDLAAAGQCLIEYLEDLLTASPKETFSKVEMLVLLNSVKHDRELMGLLRRASYPVQASKNPA